MINRGKGGVEARPHCPYGSGFTRSKIVSTEGWQDGRISKSKIADRSADRRLQLDSVKADALVIAEQHLTGNTFPSLVHIVRHCMGVGFTRSR